jgi:hypothetical protein
MSMNGPATHARAILAVVFLPLMTGCATFKSSTRLDVGPFAENTIGLIGEVQRVCRPIVWVHLREYESLPSVNEARRAMLPTRLLMRSVALYSTQVVSIYESDIPDARKSAELARYLDETIRARLKTNPSAEDFFTQDELDSAVSRVRAAPTFLAALGAAQPVVSAALAYGNSVYDSLEDRVDLAAADINARIDAEFTPLKQQLPALQDLQIQATRRYALLTQYRQGDLDALDTLRARDPDVAESLPAGGKPSVAALDLVEKQIVGRIETVRAMRDRLVPDFEIYQAQQQELDELRHQAREGARLGRITLILWARSHRNLAAGIKVPPRIDLMVLAKSAAVQAKGLIP